ncbi:MAG: ABC transporter ATP-binding protein [Blastomonas sp.]
MPETVLPLRLVIARLFGRMPGARRRQFAILILFMIASAAGEIVTIGAVLPFLAIVAAPDQSPLWDFLPISADADFSARMMTAAAILIIAAVATMVMRLSLMWYSQLFVKSVGEDIARSIFARMLRQPYAYYLDTSSSTLLAGMEKTQIVVLGVIRPGVQGISSAVIAGAILVALIIINPLAAISAALVAFGLYAGLSMATRGVLKRNSDALSTVTSSRIKSVQEGLGAIRDILLEGSQPFFEEQFARQDSRFRRAMAVNDFIVSAPRFVFEAIGIAAVAIVAVFMARSEAGLIGAIPVLGALALAAQRLLPLVQQAYLGIGNAMGNLQPLRDVVELMQEPVPELAGKADAPLPFEREIRLDRVGFRYASGDVFLDDVSLSIPRGARIGIVGQTGAGKSTLLDLVMGLLEPTKGGISIDGTPLDAGNVKAWQKNIAHVPQSIFLIDDSIAANIAFAEAKGAIDHARLTDAARKAGLGDFVDGLSDGFDTLVGERGIRMSGGERQRIGIARALYKRPAVLILDEATSALDPETEAQVIDAIMALGDDITILSIAHRRSALARCSQILRLEGGKVQVGKSDTS